MSRENLIQCNELCSHYQIEMSFFTDLQLYGIIEVIVLENSPFVHEEHIGTIEKVIRMKNDLHMNMEGIDVALNLLSKIEQLENELLDVKNRLRVYEDK